MKPGEIIPPQISEETKKSMLEFFMRTSIPRILEEKRKGVKKEIPSNEKLNNGE